MTAVTAVPLQRVYEYSNHSSQGKMLATAV